jgi:hypothetical protein
MSNDTASMVVQTFSLCNINVSSCSLQNRILENAQCSIGNLNITAIFIWKIYDILLFKKSLFCTSFKYINISRSSHNNRMQH